MRRLGRITVTLLLLAALASPGWAKVATIGTAAPLTNHSEEAIQLALKDAVETALRGALAMGLPRIRIDQALMLADAVVLQILATDQEQGDEGDAEESPGSEAPRGQPTRLSF